MQVHAFYEMTNDGKYKVMVSGVSGHMIVDSKDKLEKAVMAIMKALDQVEKEYLDEQGQEYFTVEV